ncbi:MAG TPA: HAD-IIIA family hydrolase [Gemmatimonadales bacterium]|nr:HAD-IIIA family hydrolase [Gemmatimonadales bacterium]
MSAGTPGGRRRAVFLDRDGTLIEDTGYTARPEEVRLIDGAAAAVARINAAGYLAIVATNQSGIARGLITLEQYHAVAARTAELLAAQGARLDAQFFCPHYPDVTGPCDCRKPGVKLYRDADAQFGIDFARSVWIGDRLRDVEPARTLGGTGILVLTGQGAGDADAARTEGFRVVADVGTAVRRVVQAGNRRS